MLKAACVRDAVGAPSESGAGWAIDLAAPWIGVPLLYQSAVFGSGCGLNVELILYLRLWIGQYAITIY